MKKTVIAIACAAALAATLVGCSNPPASGGSEDTSETSAPATSAPVVEPGGGTGAPTESQSPAAGTLAISMGELNMLDVHQTDSGAVADAVVQIINTGDVPLNLDDGNIKIGDANGNVIVNAADDSIFIAPSYLDPNCVGFIYTNSPLSLPDGYSAEDDYRLQGTATMIPIAGVYELPLSDIAVDKDGEGVPNMTGTVTNNTDKAFDIVEIAAVYMDNDDNTLGVASALVLELGPGESQEFTIDGHTLPVGCTMAVISGYDVIANAPVF